MSQNVQKYLQNVKRVTIRVTVKFRYWKNYITVTVTKKNSNTVISPSPKKSNCDVMALQVTRYFPTLYVTT